MTLSELVAILGLSESISIPSSIKNMEITNSEYICRFTELKYFKSSNFYGDIIYILNELVTGLDTNLASLKDFSLTFIKLANGNLRLTLTHNCI